MKILTTIFTGHTLALTDIRTVSGILIETKTVPPFFYRTIYLEITLADVPNPIRYNQHRYEGLTGMGANPEEKQKWEEQLRELETRRDELIAQWEQALQNHADAEALPG